MWTYEEAADLVDRAIWSQQLENPWWTPTEEWREAKIQMVLHGQQES